ncbi:MAG: hypothetical protein WCK34_07975, partial [Bacteroidota bacterium]
IMHKLVIFSGLVTAWYGCNGMVEWFMNRRWFVWLSSFAFIIYAMHAPLVAYATDAVFLCVGQIPHYRMLTFIFLPLVIIALAVGTGALLRRLWPEFYGVLTGGRGL